MVFSGVIYTKISDFFPMIFTIKNRFYVKKRFFTKGGLEPGISSETKMICCHGVMDDGDDDDNDDDDDDR